MWYAFQEKAQAANFDRCLITLHAKENMNHHIRSYAVPYITVCKWPFFDQNGTMAEQLIGHFC